MSAHLLRAVLAAADATHAVHCAAADAWASVDPAAEASGRWGALGALAADLAAALDGAVDRGAGGLVTGAAAQRVRAVMATWARETGR